MEILEIFKTALLLKVIIWTGICFQVLQSIKENLFENNASHLDIARHSNRQKKSIEERKIRIKN